MSSPYTQKGKKTFESREYRKSSTSKFIPIESNSDAPEHDYSAAIFDCSTFLVVAYCMRKGIEMNFVYNEPLTCVACMDLTASQEQVQKFGRKIKDIGLKIPMRIKYGDGKMKLT